MNFFEDLGSFQTSNTSLKNAIADARRWAPTLKPILIIGEEGVGKKELALEIISLSSRAGQKVSRIDPLHEMAFQSNGGTVLVENLEQFTKPQQELLLKRLGTCLGDRAMESPRWIVTANKDILGWVRRGEVLPALYQALSTQTLYIPTLAERREDIEPVVDTHISQLNSVFGNQKRISSSCLQRLKSLKCNRNWTDLLARVDSAYSKSEGPLIDLKDFGFQDLQINSDSAQLGLTLSEMEKRLIVQTLEMTQQNRTKAAEILGISIRTLRNKLNEYRDQEGA